MAGANTKTAELNQVKQKMTELESENARLTKLVNTAEADKQKALAERKDRYLRELAKLERKKDAEIAKLKKNMQDAEDRSYKEGEATYVLQCEVAKDIFFKCGWKAVVAKLTDYANAIQQKLLQEGEEKAGSPNPNNALSVNNYRGLQTSQTAQVEPPVSDMVEDVPVTDLLAGTGLPSGEARVDLDANLDDLFA
ncbi:hypothetical protein CsSME_00044852 [Camellia sinensis var. sinensis]